MQIKKLFFTLIVLTLMLLFLPASASKSYAASCNQPSWCGDGMCDDYLSCTLDCAAGRKADCAGECAAGLTYSDDGYCVPSCWLCGSLYSSWINDNACDSGCGETYETTSQCYSRACPTPAPSCSSFSSCSTCLSGSADCGWNGSSCEDGGDYCPSGYSYWYYSNCSANVCGPTPTPIPPLTCQDTCLYSGFERNFCAPTNWSAPSADAECNSGNCNYSFHNTSQQTNCGSGNYCWCSQTTSAPLCNVGTTCTSSGYTPPAGSRPTPNPAYLYYKDFLHYYLPGDTIPTSFNACTNPAPGVNTNLSDCSYNGDCYYPWCGAGTPAECCATARWEPDGIPRPESGCEDITIYTPITQDLKKAEGAGGSKNASFRCYVYSIIPTPIPPTDTPIPPTPTPKCVSDKGEAGYCITENASCSILNSATVNYTYKGTGYPYCSSATAQCCVPSSTCYSDAGEGTCVGSAQNCGNFTSSTGGPLVQKGYNGEFCTDSAIPKCCVPQASCRSAWGSGNCIANQYCPTSYELKGNGPQYCSDTSTPYCCVPVACGVSTSPSTLTLNTGGGTGIVSATVYNLPPGRTVSRMNFGSYDTNIATVNPTYDNTSVYSTTATSKDVIGSTAVWATAILDDNSQCQSSGDTDTDVNVIYTGGEEAPTPIPTLAPGAGYRAVVGVVFIDTNMNGIKDGSESCYSSSPITVTMSGPTIIQKTQTYTQDAACSPTLNYKFMDFGIGTYNLSVQPITNYIFTITLPYVLNATY